GNHLPARRLCAAERLPRPLEGHSGERPGVRRPACGLWQSKPGEPGRRLLPGLGLPEEREHRCPGVAAWFGQPGCPGRAGWNLVLVEECRLSTTCLPLVVSLLSPR